MTRIAPIIVTATFEPADFAWLDALRRAHYPAGRNLVPAHLTLFHHLPPSIEGELGRRLQAECRGASPPAARLTGLARLGRGVAIKVESRELQEFRARTAEAFAAMLTPQDAAPWRPHITIQNKVEPDVARALHERLEEGFRPRTIAIAGLATWRYLDGPWEQLARYSFSRSGRSRRN